MTKDVLAPSSTRAQTMSPPANEAEPVGRSHADLISDEGQTGNIQSLVLGADEDADAQTVPNGGYGWVIVAVCFIQSFWVNLWSGSWGILQAALLRTTLQHSSLTTLSYIGTMGVAMGSALGIPTVRLAGRIGARATMLGGTSIYGIGCVLSGSAVSSVPGLFMAYGVTYGIGSSPMYTLSSTLPVQWFDTRLGTANGIIKLGGGVGAMVGVVATGYLTDSVGVGWTLRIIGIASLATSIPTVLLIKERPTSQGNYFLNWSLFKNRVFSCVFVVGAVGIFAIYAPVFFLPYINTALGLSNSTSIGVVTCLYSCMSLGRLIAGFACDKIGAMNTLFLSMLITSISLFAIWPFASNLGILLSFAIVNGIANGGLSVGMPTGIARQVGKDKAANAISLLAIGWVPGLLVGNAISGALIEATGAEDANSIVPFRPSLFYFGGAALLSAAFSGIARLSSSPSLSSLV